eukprot:COSAG06_NODE_3365_length_5449_cov_2.510280_5_plen_58_part_00
MHWPAAGLASVRRSFISLNGSAKSADSRETESSPTSLGGKRYLVSVNVPNASVVCLL